MINLCMTYFITFLSYKQSINSGGQSAQTVTCLVFLVGTPLGLDTLMALTEPEE